MTEHAHTNWLRLPQSGPELEAGLNREMWFALLGAQYGVTGRLPRGKPGNQGAGLQFSSIWGLKSVTMSVLCICSMKTHKSYSVLGTELERPQRGGQALQRQ